MAVDSTADSAIGAANEMRPGLWRRMRTSRIGRRLLGHRLFMTGLVLLAIILLMSLFAGWLAPYSPVVNDYRYRLGPPNAAHWMGTDSFGRDVFSRMLYGSRVSLRIGFMVTLFTGIVGTLLGLCAGYFRRLENPIMRLMDALMAFPGILLAIALASVLGPSETNVVIALVITYTPRTARIMRAAALVLSQMEFVQAAKAAGAGHMRILFRHIAMNSLAPLIVQMTFIFAVSILAEAVLSFIGVGPPPPTPTWGNIIADGRDFIPDAPWVCLFPGIVVAMTVLGLNLIGDGLRDVLDPRVRVDR
jgi:peptide/nickel transport system permease protein